jgi:hypothetical protein
VGNAAIQPIQTGDDRLGEQHGTAVGGQTGILGQGGPRHKARESAGDRPQLLWEWRDEGGVVDEAVGQHLLGDVDPPHHAQVLLLPNLRQVLQPLEAPAVAELRR